MGTSLNQPKSGEIYKIPRINCHKKAIEKHRRKYGEKKIVVDKRVWELVKGVNMRQAWLMIFLFTAFLMYYMIEVYELVNFSLCLRCA